MIDATNSLTTLFNFMFVIIRKTEKFTRVLRSAYRRLNSDNVAASMMQLSVMVTVLD